MTCEEFERVLPELEGGHTLEQEAHLRSCSACSDLLTDLNAISAGARTLSASEEPSPLLWKSIEQALRSEGLIRESHPVYATAQGSRRLEDENYALAGSGRAGVLDDLSAIAQEARLLQGSEEPPQRVWNSIEIALKNEGLIREPLVEVRSVKSVHPKWRLAWLVPAAVAAMLIMGTLLFQHGGGRQQMATNFTAGSSTLRVVADSPTQAEERELIRVVSERAPALTSAYEADLKVIDSYIDDAETSARADPQDEVAQQYLMSAYEQRAMIYEMAMNRSMR